VVVTKEPSKQIIPVNSARKIGQDEAFDHMVFFHFKACPIKECAILNCPPLTQY